MADNKDDRGPQDRSRVNTSEMYELQYWSKKFGVTPGEVKAAVDKVGPMVNDVEAELKRAQSALR